MKEFINKILESKYIGNIALVGVAIILIVVIYLISIQYKDSQDVSIYTNDTDIYSETDIYENNKENIENTNNKEETKPQDKVEDEADKNTAQPIKVASLKLKSKGKDVGVALKKTRVTENEFAAITNFLKDKAKSTVTTDTVVSVELEELLSKGADIKSASARIYDENGKVIFSSQVLIQYNKVTVAVDELPASTAYYCAIDFTYSNSTIEQYVFKF